MITSGNLKIDAKGMTGIEWNGITIPANICSEIMTAYQQMNTAERIRDYVEVEDEAELWNLAGEARSRMEENMEDMYGGYEEEAIINVLTEEELYDPEADLDMDV